MDTVQSGKTSPPPQNDHYVHGGIKSKERSVKFAEVFTADWTVRDMLDMLEKENRDFFSDSFNILTATYLDPAVGTGNFPAEILRRKFAVCETIVDGVVAIGSIYAIDIQPDNVEETRERLKDMFVARFGRAPEGLDQILERNILCADFLTGLTPEGEKIWFLEDCPEYWADIEKRQKAEAKKARAKARAAEKKSKNIPAQG